MFAHILVIADQKEGGKNILRKVEYLCHSLCTKVTVLRCLTGSDAYTKTQIDHEYELLEKQSANLLSSSNIRLEVVVARDMADWIIDFCKKQKFDLLIKTGHRSETDFYTPTDWKLIRLAPCSVMIAGHKQWKKHPVILGSLDLKSSKPVQQHLNKKVIEVSQFLTACFSGKKHFVSCIQVARALLELDVVGLSAVENKYHSSYDEKMSRLLATEGVVHEKKHIHAGAVEKVISHCANSIKADLVLVGSIGRKGAKGILVGNTAERLLRFLSSDVLVLRP